MTETLHLSLSSRCAAQSFVSRSRTLYRNRKPVVGYAQTRIRRPEFVLAAQEPRPDAIAIALRTTTTTNFFFIKIKKRKEKK
jgi:hypothetical protein